jgi:hypothetical protein
LRCALQKSITFHCIFEPKIAFKNLQEKYFTEYSNFVKQGSQMAGQENKIDFCKCKKE